jgi:hypothetical protein
MRVSSYLMHLGNNNSVVQNWNSSGAFRRYFYLQPSHFSDLPSTVAKSPGQRANSPGQRAKSPGQRAKSLL